MPEITLNTPLEALTYDFRFMPERNAQGQMQSVLVIGRDITAHRQAEKNYGCCSAEMLNGFRAARNRLRRPGKACGLPFLDVNPAFERITGLQAHNLLGKAVREILPDTEPYWIET